LNTAAQIPENAILGPQYIGTKKAAQCSEILRPVLSNDVL